MRIKVKTTFRMFRGESDFMSCFLWIVIFIYGTVVHTTSIENECNIHDKSYWFLLYVATFFLPAFEYCIDKSIFGHLLSVGAYVSLLKSILVLCYCIFDLNKTGIYWKLEK